MLVKKKVQIISWFNRTLTTEKHYLSEKKRHKTQRISFINFLFKLLTACKIPLQPIYSQTCTLIIYTYLYSTAIKRTLVSVVYN